MDNALENNNLEEGQVTDNVGQDEATQQEESKGDWESQAKYFQSEKDKLQTENQKLKEYEQIGRMLESRPDIVSTISGMVQGGQPAVHPRDSHASGQGQGGVHPVHISFLETCFHPLPWLPVPRHSNRVHHSHRGAGRRGTSSRSGGPQHPGLGQRSYPVPNPGAGRLLWR